MVWVDTRKGECSRIEIGARKGLHVTGEGLLTFQTSRVVHAQGDGGDFQQRIGLWIEARRFHIDGYGKETTKTRGDRERFFGSHDYRIRDLRAFGDETDIESAVAGTGAGGERRKG